MTVTMPVLVSGIILWAILFLALGRWWEIHADRNRRMRHLEHNHKVQQQLYKNQPTNLRVVPPIS